ncbi:MAG: type II and III secretion system protein family protein [Maricaulaceae bacterium]
MMIRKATLRAVFALLASLTATIIAASAQAQPIPQNYAHGNLIKVRIDEGGQGPVSRDLLVALNKAAVIDLPVNVRDVIIPNPGIADAVIRTPRRVQLLGVGVGETNAFFYDAAGKLILNLEITVGRDLDALNGLIARLVPEARIKAEPLNAGIVLSGVAPNLAAADRARQLALQFVEEDDELLNLVIIEGKDQVLLKVRVIEMNRSVIKRLGVDLGLVLQSGEVGVGLVSNPAFLLGTPPGSGLLGSATFANTGDTGLFQSISAALTALESVSLVRTLAEPNLTAISGETANFLSGGEFPIPVAQGDDGQITVEFRPFGVGLNFTPVVLSEGRISLRIATEVSDITPIGGIPLAGVPPPDGAGPGLLGIAVPGLTVRRTETTVEVPSGGSLVISGLISETTRQALEGVPGAKDIPIFGQLFRTTDTEREEAELLVIVSPYLVDPTSPNVLQTPADGVRTPRDAKVFFLQQINEVYGVASSSDTSVAWSGPVGPVLE